MKVNDVVTFPSVQPGRKDAGRILSQQGMCPKCNLPIWNVHPDGGWGEGTILPLCESVLEIGNVQ